MLHSGNLRSLFIPIAGLARAEGVRRPFRPKYHPTFPSFLPLPSSLFLLASEDRKQGGTARSGARESKEANLLERGTRRDDFHRRNRKEGRNCGVSPSTSRQHAALCKYILDRPFGIGGFPLAIWIWTIRYVLYACPFWVADCGRSPCMGDARRRGRASVRDRPPGQRLVLREHRPELHTSRDLVRLLPGPARDPLLPGPGIQQRHDQRPDKLSLGGAEQRRDIQRRDERPGQKSTRQIRRVHPPPPRAGRSSPTPRPCRSTIPLYPPGDELMPVGSSSGRCFRPSLSLPFNPVGGRDNR